MDNKGSDHNFLISPRADSFVSIDTTSQTSEHHHAIMKNSTSSSYVIPDDVATPPATDPELEPMDEDDDAIIKCICGYGKGYDDDDATSCERCETWQHNLCYFKIYDRPYPQDGDHFLCLDCGSTEDLDPDLAAKAMCKKLQSLELMSDKIDELRAEVMVRNEELDELEIELACLEGDLYTMGPELDAMGPGPAWLELDEWHEEWLLINEDIAKTIANREGTLDHIYAIEEDQARVKRNEPTVREEQRLLAEKERPKLWTTASSLAGIGCIPNAKPDIFNDKDFIKAKKAMAVKTLAAGGEVLAANADGANKVTKRKKKRRIG